MIRFRLVVAALLTAAAVMTAVPAPAEQVPNVLGMHYDTAKKTLQGAGFTVNDKGFHPTSNQRLDRLILTQEPAPGAAAARGAIVRITPLVYIEPRVLSQMPKPPALSPESQRVLSQLEQGKNPQQAQPSQPPPQAKPPQPPPPQAQPPKVDTFPAPNLIGMTYEQAREFAPGSGLLVSISGTVVCRTQAGPMNVCPSTPVKTAMMGAPAPYNPHLAGGRVVKQDPGGGMPVRKGYTITVAVERTVSNCIQMPRVIGLNSSHATQTLRNYGFAAVKTQLISTREKSAPVQLQTPREGSWVLPSCTEVSLGL